MKGESKHNMTQKSIYEHVCENPGITVPELAAMILGVEKVTGKRHDQSRQARAAMKTLQKKGYVRQTPGRNDPAKIGWAKNEAGERAREETQKELENILRQTSRSDFWQRDPIKIDELMARQHELMERVRKSAL